MQYYVGWFLTGVTALNILSNMIVMGIASISEGKKELKKIVGKIKRTKKGL